MTMDIPRPSNARAKKIRRIVYSAAAVIFIVGVTAGLSRLRPAHASVSFRRNAPNERRGAAGLLHPRATCDEGRSSGGAAVRVKQWLVASG